ncbi:MAG TPA: hypothetical protein VK403_09625 [Allosphingosinicella sp.]|nr:hypothetical protein [Allosphingosinicella sp.]
MRTAKKLIASSGALCFALTRRAQRGADGHPKHVRCPLFVATTLPVASKNEAV